jgi:PST family polysaccharide transporter
MRSAPLSVHDAEAELKTDHLLEDIGKRSLRGGALSFGAQGAKVVLQIATVVVLTRLLPPSAFGLIAMVAALGAVLDTIKELGLSAATIRKPDLTHAQVTSLFWINAAVGLGGALFLVLTAPLIADFYHQPQLVWVTRTLALAFLANGLSVQHWSLLRRQMRFGAVVTVDIGGEVTGFVLAITLAVSGFGYWALVAQRVGGPVFALVSCWAFCRWRPGWPQLASGVRELVAFGASVTGVNIATALARNVDQILIGWMWGPSLLGLYDRASRVMIAPINNFGPPLYAVGMPAFSRIADQRERYANAFTGLLEKLSMATMPAAAIVALCAPWVERLLFGPRWAAATPLIAWFSTAVVYTPLIQTVGLLYLTQNRPREMLRAAFVDSALCVSAIAAAVSFGPVWVAAAIAISGLAIRLPVQFALAGLRGPVGFADLARAVGPSALAAALVALTATLVRFLLPQDVPAAIGIAVTVLAAGSVGLGCYIAIPKSRRALIDIRNIVRTMRRSHHAPHLETAGLGGATP